MKQPDIALSHCDYGEYGEGPRRAQRPLVLVICQECGRSFLCADAGAMLCPQCLWKELKEKHR